jgi:arylsulfatase A-like enzyme
MRRITRHIRLLAVAILFGLAVKTSIAADRPNILWLITEDMGPEQGCYGTDQVWTPTIDALAANGVRYDKAFTVTPVCSTSRSGFCTGMHPISIGAHQHRTKDEHKKPLPEGVKAVTDWFRGAGYWTANIKSMGGKKYGTGKVDWDFTYEGEPFDGAEWDDLKSHQPFYAQVNFSQSHRGWTAPKKADPAKVALPSYYPDHPEARADWAAYLDEITEVDGLIARALTSLEKEGMADKTIVVVMGDHGRAHVRGKQWPYDSGLRIPLIIHVPEALGTPAGYKRGQVDDQLIASIDVTATSLALAGIEKPTKMQGRVFLGDAKEEKRAYTYASRDRCDMTTFRIRTVRGQRYRYIRNFMPERPFLQLNLYKERSYPMIGLMRELHSQGKLDETQAALLAPRRPTEELYLIEEDPYEVNNLVGSSDKKHQRVLARLRDELDRWIEDAGDHGRKLEDPAIGEGILAGVIDRSSPDKLNDLKATIHSQIGIAGVDADYIAYLKRALVKLEHRLANPLPATKKRKKK